MPASEIVGWMEYFSIYPFTPDREDFRTARLCEMINLNTQMLGFKDKSSEFFMPDYLTDRILITDEQKQIAAELAFAAKLEALNDNQT